MTAATTPRSVPTRDEVPREMTWDLSTIFVDVSEWEKAFADVAARLPLLEKLQATLGRDGASLLQALRQRDDVGATLGRVVEYVVRRHHEDTTESFNQGLADRAAMLAIRFDEATAFFTPEILSLTPAQLEQFVVAAPDLTSYTHYLDDLARLRPHVRSAEVELLLAGAAEIGEAPETIFGMIDNADLHLPSIEDEDGQTAPMTTPMYQKFLHSNDRAVRRRAFEGFLGTFRLQQHTLAATLGSQVKRNLFFARARGYDSALEAALDENNIPTAVYTTLIETVRRSLPSLHRYLALRARVLNLGGDAPHMYDLYAPLIREAQVAVPYDRARAQLVEALAPLGEGYTTLLRQGMSDRWIDVLENKGKVSGAYSAGAYGTVPFTLLNYRSTLDDEFTLAHEMGHSIHTYLAHDVQPYVYAGYSIFLAEVASTLNEELLREHLLSQTTDPRVKATLIVEHLDHIRATLFRQTLFAEFELVLHERAAEGESLTVDMIRAVYRGLVEDYYGAGGIVVDDLIAWEWSSVPHFYDSFYVYQYATGCSAAAALSRAILTEGEPARARYLSMLRAGSSDYPIALLRQAGVDMTTAAPVEAAIAAFDRSIDDLAALLPTLNS